ncbi:MAG: outer membrane protein transport protein [Rubrivivax sp.]|nr:outer membrane protein transport protein [Rubrivivax sp.]
MRRLNRFFKLTPLAALCVTLPALATNGYFSHGYGMKAKGMGGAATATASDSFGGAVNPAAMVFAGERLDVGLDVFSPRRSASRQGSTGFGGGYDGYADSDSNYFFVPEFGYNKVVNSKLTLGVSVYGNGGMNTNYDSKSANPSFAPSCQGAPSNLLFGCGRLGVDLMQLIIAPTASYKISEAHSIGISPLLGYQRFKVEGLQAFDETLNMGFGPFTFTSSQGNTTNRGYDGATGFGVRVGWMGKISDTVTLGAAYSSKIRMDKFEKYKGLFAEQGGFDIPENYNFGIAVKAMPTLMVAFDVQQINYSKVASIANGVANTLLSLPPVAPNRLGDANGSGFNWRDQTVYKLGAEYEYAKGVVLRGGFNYGRSPIRDGDMADISFNIIAPGVVEKHLTLGATWTLASKAELTFSYMHAFTKSVTGPSATALLGVGGTETLKMSQNALGIAYGVKF